MSTLSTANIQSKAANTPPVIKDLNGTECASFCRAYVSFNGTGTLTINNSLNVSSITDQNTGRYKIHFTTPFSNNDYCITHGANFVSGNGFYHWYQNPATDSFDVRFIHTGNAYADPTHVSCVVHGD